VHGAEGTEEQQTQQQPQTPPAAGGTSWEGATADEAKSNNPFAGQVLSQQTNGPITTTTTANEHGGMTLQTTADMDGNGENEASLTSAFDESGNLRSNSYTMDNSGDGVVDYGEAYTYDGCGDVTGHVVVEDTDYNGTMETQSHTQDTDGNGLLDSKTTVVYDDQGNLLNRSQAKDVNEDGIMDYAFNETFDAEGNRTSYGTQIFEDGIYGSAGQPVCPCPVGEPEPVVVSEPVVVPEPEPVDPPSNGGTAEAPTATAPAEFVSEDAGYSNALYTYDVDDAGNVTNIRQVMDNSNAMTAGDSLGDVSMTDGKPNLLLLPNGSNLVDENSELTILDGKLHIDGQEYTGDAYFSHSTEMSTDGKQHFQFSTDEAGHTTVKMEDLRNLGDNDFNDLEIKVFNGVESPSSGGAVVEPLGVSDASIKETLDAGGEFKFTFNDQEYSLRLADDGKYKAYDANNNVVDGEVRIQDDFTVDGFVEVGGLSGLGGGNRLYIGADPSTGALAFVEASAELDANDALIEGRSHLTTMMQVGTRHPALVADTGSDAPMTESQALATIEADFGHYDTDGSGFLSKQELQVIVDAGGPLAPTAQSLIDNYNGSIFGNIDPSANAWAGMSANDLTSMKSSVDGGGTVESAAWESAIQVGIQRGVVSFSMSALQAIAAMNMYVEETQDRLGVQDDENENTAATTDEV
jgi:hypothetical protein